MTTLYWKGTGSWDNSNTANWWTATNGGGSNPGAAPTSTDAVVFDANSGGTCTIGTGAVAASLEFAAYTGTFAFGSNRPTITNVTANATVVNGGAGHSVTGTPIIDVVCGTTNTAVAMGSATEANAISINFAGAGGGGSRTAGGSFKSLLFDSSHVGVLAGSTRTLYGNLALAAGVAVAGSNLVTTFAATSGTQTFTSAGVSFQAAVTINAPGATVALADAFSGTRAFIVTAGIFSTAGFNFSPTLFNGSGATTRTIDMTGSTVAVLGVGTTAWVMTTTTGLTCVAPTVLTLTSASAKSFNGGGLTYNKVVQGGTGALTVVGANTIAEMSNTAIGSIFFTSGVTQAIAIWSLNGTAGNLLTVNSTSAGSPATISKSSGTVSADYLSLKDITATGGATFYAGANSTNTSGNTGWIFTAAPNTSTGNFFLMF